MAYSKEELEGAIEETVKKGQLEFVNIEENRDKYSRFLKLYTLITGYAFPYDVAMFNKKDLVITVDCQGKEVMIEVSDSELIMNS